MKFHEIRRNFMTCAEFSCFGGNFTIFGVLERFESSRGAQKPQYSYRNINVFSMWRPGNHQNPPESDFCIIFKIFQEFCGKWWNFGEFRENNSFLVFSGFRGSKLIRPWFWARNTKVSWRVAESRKSMKFMKFHDFHEISTISLNFLNFNEFHRIDKKPTV